MNKIWHITKICFRFVGILIFTHPSKLKSEMKKLFTIVAILICFLSNAQQLKTPIKELSAGDELIKAKKQFNTGICVTGVGALISILGIATAEPGSAGPVIGIAATGGVFALVGLGFTISSFSHIGKAGEKLNQNKSIAIGPTSTGIGIKMRF